MLHHLDYVTQFECQPLGCCCFSCCCLFPSSSLIMPHHVWMEHTWKEAPLLRQPPLVIRAGEKKMRQEEQAFQFLSRPLLSLSRPLSLTHSNMLSHSHTHPGPSLSPFYHLSWGGKKKAMSMQASNQNLRIEKTFLFQPPSPSLSTNLFYWYYSSSV